MTTQRDLDRMLGAWFGAEAAAAAKPEPLVLVLNRTRRLRPRPSFIASLGSNWVGTGSLSAERSGTARLRQAVVFALVVLISLLVVGGALLVAGRLLVPTQRAYGNEFVALPDVSRPLAYPQVVPLLDGRVFVIGHGGDGGDQTITAEFYDPATGTSTPLGPVTTPRGFVDRALRLNDGRVLILADGAGQVFDPTTLLYAPVGPMVHPLRGPAALLHDGRVLIAGEFDGDFEAELLDPQTLTFSTTGAMGSTAGPLVVLADGRVLVVPDGGDMAQVYDPITGSFEAAGGPATPFGVSSAVSLPDGRVIVFGSVGAFSSRHLHTEIWDLTSMTFATVADPPGQVNSATLLDNGKVLLIGGVDPGRGPAWSGIYGPATGVTTRIQAPTAWSPTATRLADGRVLLVGGLRDGDMYLGPGSVMHDAPAVSIVEIFQ